MNSSNNSTKRINSCLEENQVEQTPRPTENPHIDQKITQALSTMSNERQPTKKQKIVMPTATPQNSPAVGPKR